MNFNEQTMEHLKALLEKVLDRKCTPEELAQAAIAIVRFVYVSEVHERGINYGNE